VSIFFSASRNSIPNPIKHRLSTDFHIQPLVPFRPDAHNRLKRQGEMPITAQDPEEQRFAL
jgi:hypothetical protein